MSLSDRDRALAATRGRSALARGDAFVWYYWQAITRLYPAVTWEAFLDWEGWMVGAALGLDRIEPDEAEQEIIDRFNEASRRAPSSDRKG